MDVASGQVIDRCLRAMRAQGLPATAADIARRFDMPASTVGMVLRGERKLQPEMVLRLGTLAGLPVAELHRTLGWLPEREPEPPRPTEPGTQLAPLLAAAALAEDPEAAQRWRTELSHVVSGDRYRTVTTSLAAFHLVPDMSPLPYERAERLAVRAGLDWRPPTRDDHGSLRLELCARTLAALHGQECSWQGGPGRLTWGQGGDHLLVQDPIAGRQRPASPHGWRPERPGALVVVGSRGGTGLAAALLAEALGWQFVLVRSDIRLTADDRLVPVLADTRRDRVRAWIEVAERIAEREWRVVVLVRPSAFADPDTAGLDRYAADLLRDTPARILYARSPDGFLDWWHRRAEGNHRPGEYSAAKELALAADQYLALEQIMAERTTGRGDILLDVPSDGVDLLAHSPRVPSSVMDWSARVAWSYLRRLAPNASLRPGLLRDWSESLRNDPLSEVPALTELD